MNIVRHFGVNHAALAYAMTTLGSCMINNIFSFYYVKLFLNKYNISEGAFHQSQVSIFSVFFFFLLLPCLQTIFVKNIGVLKTNSVKLIFYGQYISLL